MKTRHGRLLLTQDFSPEQIQMNNDDDDGNDGDYYDILMMVTMMTMRVFAPILI